MPVKERDFIKDMTPLKIHWKFAVKSGTRWVSLDEKGKYYLSSNRKNAETRWDMRGALGIKERYLASSWNVTMGEKPEMNIVKIHRPQRINWGW
jgi:hypothetical protein